MTKLIHNNFYKKNIKYYKLYIIIIIILICLILYYLYKYLYNVKSQNNKIDNFELLDPNATTMCKEPTRQPIVERKPCNGDNNLVNYCMAVDECCNDSNKTANKCYCEHSFVKNCKDVYTQCITQNGQTSPKCKDELKDCCVKYNSIAIDSSNFNKPILQEQKNNIICSLNFIKNIGAKCNDLCQTNDECKAYSISKSPTGEIMACNLYSSITPLPQSDGSKSITEYYTKK